MSSPIRNAKVVAITNQKGGVGKTTSTINLAASLAVAEQRTLVIDFDPQGHASLGLGVPKEKFESTGTVYDALIGNKSLKDIIIPTEMDFLHLAPADSNLAGAEVEMVGMISRETKLKRAIDEVRSQYDYILIDSTPSLGLLTVNVLTAADSYIVPLQCEYFAMEGLGQLLHTVSLVKDGINPRLELEGILLTMADTRNKLTNEVEKQVREHFGDRVYATVIPRNIKLSECSSHGKPVLLYDIDSKGCVAYLNLAKEFLNRNRPVGATTGLLSTSQSLGHEGENAFYG